MIVEELRPTIPVVPPLAPHPAIYLPVNKTPSDVKSYWIRLLPNKPSWLLVPMKSGEENNPEMRIECGMECRIERRRKRGLIER